MTSARRLVAAAAALAALLVAAPVAGAHPLGNFSVNRLDVVSVSRDAVVVSRVVDQAEIPTFQERGRAPSDVLAAKREDAERGLTLVVDDHEVPLRAAGPGEITFPDGQGGLTTTRVELRFTAAVDDPRSVELRDDSYSGRVGWKAIVVRPGDGTAVRSSVPSADPTGGLRHYPRAQLSAPPDERSATLSVRPGDGTVSAPGAAEVSSEGGGSSGFAGIIDDAAAGRGLLILFLLAAFGWGALHALSPGHGKSMVAAYLVGTRGRPRDAVLLGATVTVTHTAGVFALGFVTLALTGVVLPEDIYPWLELVSGALVIAVGAGVLRNRIRRARGHDTHVHHHHDHVHGAHGHHHHHHHDDAPADRSHRRDILALGASAGLIPCPSALVVLLGAIGQHEVALGMLLILAFSFGLAATLTALGLAVVLVKGRLAKANVPHRVALAARVLPVGSALVIVALGIALTARAVPAAI